MKRLAFFTFLIFASYTISAQSYVELGGFLGIANYQGDLSQDPIEFGATKFSVGGLVRYHYGPRLYFKGSVYAGQISGSDLNADPESGNFARGWSMTSNLLEVTINAEWLPLAKTRFNDVGIFRAQINPYLFVGIGSNFSKPVVDWENGATPAVGFPEEGSTRNFLVVPMGGGLRFDFTQWSTLGFEAGWRYTNSDYIDGISQNASGLSGNTKPDWYFFWGVTLSTYFGEQEDFGL